MEPVKELEIAGFTERQDDLWSRITALAKKEDISYLEATQRCVKGYWKDCGLRKEP